MGQERQRKMPFLIYAIDANNNLIHIDSVSRGSGCRCYCPKCGNELIAKNGGKRKVHHFAHVKGSDCVGAAETILHRMAKDILYENKVLMLPPDRRGESGRQIKFNKVERELFDEELSLRPDCVGYTDRGDVLWIEFKRTHAVDLNKANKIRTAKKDCVEIDLNDCEADLEKVRCFIESTSDNRIWIYNSRIPDLQYIGKKGYSSMHLEDEDFEVTQDVDRHLARNDNNVIVYSKDLRDVDKSNSYYCLACGKEVVVCKDLLGNHTFCHIDKRTACSTDLYLHEAAKYFLCGKFNTQQEFNVQIPQKHFCERGSKCPLFNEERCYVEIPVSYNLKKHGYDAFDIDSDKPFYYDAVIKRGNDSDNSIIIYIDSGECYIEPEELNHKMIEITVEDEEDILKWNKEPLGGGNVRFNKFLSTKNKTIPCKKINRQVLKFTLYSSGKYYLGFNSCIVTRRKSAVYEMIMLQDIGDDQLLKQYCIMQCYNRQKKICLCEICYYLKCINGNQICKRYKTKGTPKNPLKTRPLNCEYFNLDRNIKSILEREFQGFKFIENDYNDI